MRDTTTTGDSMRRAALLCLPALLLAACGGTDNDSSSTGPTVTSSSSSATTSAAPEPVEPYEAYTDAVSARGISPGITEQEAVSVAGNTCDNTVADMSGLVTGMQSLYTESELAEVLVDRAYFIDAYCPDARVVYDAGTQAALGVVVPPA
ncbi:hypothetical protein [Klenkia terrae]|uniref:DUF732 domain-containing protein n=1 Tax=Klenkia terrae TaxID=1052259 RepID=A0ABU8E4E7_9ACTN|nr:hypothetical protein [Klenkia terrae]